MNTLTLPHYKIRTSISDGCNTSVYRGIRESDAQPVIIKILKAEFPTLEQITRLKNEYKITQHLQVESIVKSYSLETYQNRLALILEDFGGCALSQIISKTQKLNLTEFLNIGIQLASALSSLHQNGIIHKDIKPSNIIINQETGTVKLTDFSIASRLSKENPQINSTTLVEGTIAYMSPEQTGRMNRTLDYRSDFYSLGVTFYEMLTGKLPFNSNDILELVHRHIAKHPVPPRELGHQAENREIPQVISDIVMKLLAKNAEDRYQTAEGIKADLESCFNSLQAIGKVVDFVPGQLDRSGQLSIPQKLYGRETEVDSLLAAFERVGTRQCVPTGDSNLLLGRSEIVLVSGYSGIGKTAIVNEVHKPIVRQRGYFINGKFDQFKRNIPYAALIQAFQSLIGQLLAESSEKLQVWQEKISAALGANGAVIADVIPEIELIVGKQPEVPQLGPAESQNRFNRVFQEFIGVFTQAEHPLVIFLDDLQWADAASLNLMQLLVGNSDSQYLLLIGAYRDNEVSPTHPLIHAIEQIEKTGTPVNNIVLQPLNVENVRELIADTLTVSHDWEAAGNAKSGNEKIRLLAELIFHKTGGNPFFITQLLQALYQENLLKFEYSSGSWQWDLAEIQAIGITDKTVVELVASRIEKLPETTQQMLELAACIGDKFSLDVLSIVSEQSPAQAASELWAALQAGLVLPLSNAYKIPLLEGWGTENLPGLAQGQGAVGQSKISYKFLHDRVQQAAYSLIPESEKQETHVKIGQLLLENTPDSEIEENVFDIVNQLNVGAELLAEKTEKYRLAKLNLIAGKKAKASNAYEAAVRYLNVGLELIDAIGAVKVGKSSWETDYELTLNLHVAAAEAEYLNTNFDRSQHLADVVLKQAVNVLDKIKVYEIQIQSDMSQNQMLKALDTGLKALEILGFPLSEIPSDGFLCIKLPQLEELENIPVMTDEYELVIMRILSVILSPAFAGKPEVLPQIVFTMVNFSMKHGHSALGAIGYSWYGLLLSGAVGKIDSGYHSGLLALKLLDRFNAKELKCKVYNMFNSFVRHWKEHVRKTIVSLTEAVQIGLETGDLTYTVYAASNIYQALCLVGEPLDIVEQKHWQYLKLSMDLKQEVVTCHIKIWGQFILNLMERSNNKYELVGSQFNELEMLPQLLEVKNYLPVFNVYFCKTILFYLFKQPEEAVASAYLTAEYAPQGSGLIMMGTHNFYYSLALLAAYPTADSATQEKYLMQVATNQEQMQIWAHHAPMNYQHKYDLVEAEKARIFGKDWEAADYYDKAIEGAKQQEYIQEEALANELAAEFYFSRNKDKIARVYLTESYYGYIRWGAIAKVKNLEARYPQLVTQTLTPETKSRDLNVTATTTTTNSDFGKILDTGTLIKASQAITSEIVLDKLLARSIDILLENAAAQKAVLMLYKDGNLLIQAACTVEQKQPTILQSLPIESSQDVPVSVVNYVTRTQKDLVLNNAVSDGLFAADPYILDCKPGSILCSPVSYQGKLTGILYLENNLAVGAFPAGRLQVLKVLTSQVAIVLENAKLYAQEQEKSQQLEESLHKLQQTQAQLVQTEKISSLGQLVAGVAHEVNNPVSFISGNLHHAKDYVRDLSCILNLYQQYYPNPVPEIAEAAEDMEIDYLVEDLPKMLGSMQLGIDRIRDIMQSLRNFSRVDGNQKKPADIHAGIESTLMILQHRLKAKPERPAIPVIKEYGNLPEVECYSGQLNQVFMNLLSNAIDALDEFNADRTYNEIENHPNIIAISTEIKEGSATNFVADAVDGTDAIKKEVGTGNLEEIKGEGRGAKVEKFAVIRIKDNGPGMDEVTRCKLFEPFFTTKPEGKGTGLGLSISYQIVVEKHGGAIECISQPGKGAEFVITIPLEK